MRRITRLLEHPKDPTMSFRSGYPLTPTQYAAELERLNRPITDRPVGGHTRKKRQADAEASAAFGINEGTVGEPVEPWQAEWSLCGTDRGYNRHIRNMEPACGRCRKAHAAKSALWRRRRKDVA